MDIVCRKTTCHFNELQKCMRKNLAIDKYANCDDIKIDKTKKEIDVSKNIFEQVADYSSYRHSKCIDINCASTNCVFNKEKKCIANGIIVGSKPDNAECITYIEG